MTEKQKRCARTFFLIGGLWLFGAVWWGLTILAPMQLHNHIVRGDLPFLIAGAALFFIIALWEKGARPSFNCGQKGWAFTAILFLGVDLAAIYYWRNIPLSLLLSSFFLLLLGEVLQIRIFKKMGAVLSLTSLGIAGTAFLIYLSVGRPNAGAGFFAPQIAFILNLTGKNCAFRDGTLMMTGKRIRCDLIKLGLFPWAAFCSAFIATLFCAKAESKKKILCAAWGILLSYLFLLVRFAMVASFSPSILLAGDIPFNLFFWRIPLLSFLLLIPLWLFLLHSFGLTEWEQGLSLPVPPKSSGTGLLLWGAVILAFASLCGSFYFFGIHGKRNIHCIIDEVHSDWESTLIDFDKNIFGLLAENSYHSFLDYLRHYYPVSIVTDKPVPSQKMEGVEVVNTFCISPGLLDGVRQRHPDSTPILLLKCITTPFSESEIEAIKVFVSEGGGLFLIGDHTDVFFINKNLNQLASYFGIRFEQNSVYFIDGGWVITDPAHYKAHPATHYMDTFIWATGDSLKLEPPAFPLIYSSHVCFADEVNYFYDNFFGNQRVDPEESFGSFCIMAGAQYGGGRVIAFTDSTCFNNYLMFSVGRREVVAGIFGWLGAKGGKNPFPIIFLISISLFILVCIKKRPKREAFFYLTINAALIGILIGYSASSLLNSALYPYPRPIRGLPESVILDAIHDPLHCMSFGNSESFLSPASYDNLLYSMGRLNVFPKILYKGRITEDDLTGASCLVIASPRKAYCKKEQEAIYNYIKGGGALLLIEGARQDSTINQIAHLFDIHLRLDTYRDKIKEIRDALPYPLTINPGWVDGGETLYAYDAMPIVTCKRVGSGIICVIGDDGLFTKVNFARHEMRLTHLQCSVIEALIQRDIDALRSLDWYGTLY